MIYKIRLMCEFARNSIFWLYDNICKGIVNSGEWTDNDTDEWSAKLPDEILAHPQLKELTLWIAQRYNECFINNKVEFSYKGFDSTNEKEEFWLQIQKLRHIVFDELKLDAKYEIEDCLGEFMVESEFECKFECKFESEFNSGLVGFSTKMYDRTLPFGTSLGHGFVLCPACKASAVQAEKTQAVLVCDDPTCQAKFNNPLRQLFR